MTDITDVFSDPSSQKTPSGLRLVALVVMGALISLTPVVGVLPKIWNTGFFVAGVSLLAASALVVLRGKIVDYTARQSVKAMAVFAEQDLFPCVIANAQGDILTSNPEARSHFQAFPGKRLEQCLKSVFANPPAILLRLQSSAEIYGKAREDVVTVGSTIPVSVFNVGQGRFCWRFHLETPGQWDDVNIPVLTEGRNGTLLRMNDAAAHLLGQRPDMLHEVLTSEPRGQGDIVQVQTSGGAIPAVVCELGRSGTVRNLLVLPMEDAGQASSGASFAELPVPIMRLAPDGRILEANRLAVKLIGDVEPGETNVDQIMKGLGHPILDWLGRMAAQEPTMRSEFLRLTRQDKEIFLQVTLNRVVSNGQVCLIAVLNDATELKTLEAQFVQGQKMQAVGQLAGGVAHDFNNLLTAISGHCDLLLLRHDQNDPNYGDLVQINQNANRAAALVSQLLAFSRKQTLQPEVLDLRDTISDLIHLLNRLVGEKVRLILSHDPVLKPVRADKRQLEQVFMNLVVNARDAMPDGGEIRIETEVIVLNQPFTRDRATVQPGEYVTVKVIDSGTGIPADKLQKVFEPFYTTKRTGEGTGLGLSTVYGIVKQTGGFIFVDSLPGHGTEFIVYLPVSTALQVVQEETMPAADTQNTRQGEGVVLLVEDEAPVRAFATRALRLKGYTVLEADSAEEALRLLEDGALNVDVFVTDVVMPGMDGPTWVCQAMETRPDVRVIFMSGYTEGAFGDSGPKIANSTFLPKPFSLNQLTEAVFQQIN
ncbi:Blue-light-activated protein [Ruegeria denitrificans]|uniref:histidine kinase n=1 Tax=Ruegeria denitrificans TaxID=1715692 RepID=A0A0P1I797_9RHOB|nr:PAS domain-containing sensor histidine kinase [Ruegeria denitrificans]CUJ94897.1 Blue-light-activated protein [Ruegeria denitrificans]